MRKLTRLDQAMSISKFSLIFFLLNKYILKLLEKYIFIIIFKSNII